MQENLDEIFEAGGSLIAIGADTVTETKNTVDNLNLTFTVLSDSGLITTSDYNVVDQNNTRFPRPSVFIIKTDGTIGYVSLDSAYSRSSAASIISALAGL